MYDSLNLIYNFCSYHTKLMGLHPKLKDKTNGINLAITL